MKRNSLIDLLKGIAIIAVILYHLGVSKFGYLGVDIFFVISGYFVTLGLINGFAKGNFSYWSFLNKRIARLWLGLIIISIVSLALGSLVMLPAHFKIDCESVVGSLSFTNNFVQYITGGDYWTTDNELKPLMHTWYLGILMQFYLIIPLVFIVAKKYAKQWLQTAFNILTILSLVSLISYMTPLMTESQDFYMLPARFFELGAGGLLALSIQVGNKDLKNVKINIFCLLLILSAVFIFGTDIVALKLRLVIVTLISIVLVGCSNYFNVSSKVQKLLFPISFLGVASYSLYLSHQVFFAFYRYIVNNVFSVAEYLWICAASIIIGIILYLIFEKPLSRYISKRKSNMYRINGLCLVFAIGLCAISIYYYKQGGLVHDIPELDLYVNGNNQTPEEYNSEPFALDKDFEDNDKKNILVIGDSFGRDWINVLREAGVDSVMNISFTDKADEKTKERISKADIIFVASNRPFLASYDYDKIFPELFNRKFWRVGIKKFGEQFIGNIYNKRWSSRYYESSVKDYEQYRDIIIYETRMFKDRFIDMMAPVTNNDGSINLFTDDKKLITQDGLHLTKAGAKFYAQKLNVWQYLK